MVNSSAAVHNGDGSEVILPATRPTSSYYLVLVLVVIPFCAVTPASWCYVVYSLYTGVIRTFTLTQYTVFVVASAEVSPSLHLLVITDDGQVFFSVYHHNLARFVSGLSPIQPSSIVDLRAALSRVLQSGLAGFPGDGTGETLDFDHPRSSAEFIPNLAFDDPRAVDFRSYMRTW